MWWRFSVIMYLIIYQQMGRALAASPEHECASVRMRLMLTCSG